MEIVNSGGGNPPTLETSTQPAKVYFHQTSPEGELGIRSNGFKKGEKGAGEDGPLRGIFLKEIPDLLSGANIGQSQVEVELDQNTRILDLTSQPPASFVRLSKDVLEPGTQDFALAGWLEQSGYGEFAEKYQDAINSIYNGYPEKLNTMWQQVEDLLHSLGFNGVKYTDHFLKGPKVGQPFGAIVIFDPEKIKLKS